jgi:hypothetical protein
MNTICRDFGDGDVVEDAEGAGASADGKNHRPITMGR